MQAKELLEPRRPQEEPQGGPLGAPAEQAGEAWGEGPERWDELAGPGHTSPRAALDEAERGQGELAQAPYPLGSP